VNEYINLLDHISLKNQEVKFYSLPKLVKQGIDISHLPYSIRILLESALRNYDGKNITNKHIESLINWNPNGVKKSEIPFMPSRVVLQDSTGVPLLADLAAMRACASQNGVDPGLIEPLIPVDLIIDHSIQTQHTNIPNALKLNMDLEFSRNTERYEFIKWGGKAFKSFKVVPPGVGIIHQINLEYLAKGILIQNNICYPDTVIGTDSHTTMINGLGIIGWGVGGIEAEAAMLGLPMYMLIPEVIGVNLQGVINLGVTTTDVVLTLTEILRKENVVGKFVEYFGSGAKSLSAPDRVTIANMAPDYGATMGLFFVDQNTLDYYWQTGRDISLVKDIETYYKAQQLFDIDYHHIKYSKVIDVDLSKINPCISGPKRPQDRIELKNVRAVFTDLLKKPTKEGGYGKKSINNGDLVKEGDIIIAGITSCTNTSNPSVLIAAGLLAKKAVEKGLIVNKKIKTSITPGSRAVTKYLEKAGLQKYLDALGFYTAGYGCTTCVGGVGDINKEIEDDIIANDIIACAVLSGNRNFEARIHRYLRANFLMSPPLVVAFALAGNVNINLNDEPLGRDKDGEAVYLKDIWPTSGEIAQAVIFAQDPEIYKTIYSNQLENCAELWGSIKEVDSLMYQWDEKSTYIAKPPFFDDFSLLNQPLTDILSARALAIFGDSITTDHISPASMIDLSSPAGKFLREKGINKEDFNNFGTRRGHHEVMLRGTFSNVRLRNLMLDEKEGGFTIEHCSKEHSSNKNMGKVNSIYDAAMNYKKQNIPTIIFAGKEYGTGSSRDWAAKGTYLLGVKAVIAQAFERIHRSNLIGMGVLPCQFKENISIQSLNLIGDEIFDLLYINEAIEKTKDLVLVIHKKEGEVKKFH
jgi:aconitate hydratase